MRQLEFSPSLGGSSNGAHTIFLDQSISFSHTEFILTDIHSDCGYIKQELYFGHHRNASSPPTSHAHKSDVAPTWTVMNMPELSAVQNPQRKRCSDIVLPPPLQLSPSGSLAYFRFLHLSLSESFPHWNSGNCTQNLLFSFPSVSGSLTAEV